MKITVVRYPLFMLLIAVLLAGCMNNDAVHDQRSRNLNVSSISTNDPSEDYPQTQEPNNHGQGYGNNFRPIGATQQNPNGNPFPRQDNQSWRSPIQQEPNREEELLNRDQGQEPFRQEQANEQTAESDYALNEFESEVVRLTNIERTNAGLEPLEVDNALSHVARQKSQDMQSNNYFSHQSPTYGSPFDMMSQYNITYRSAAENIARGQQSPQSVVQEWMNSQGHRENILNGGFTHIGVGYEGVGNYWTQMFIRK